MTKRSCASAKSITSWSSGRVRTVPTGFQGVLSSTTRALGRQLALQGGAVEGEPAVADRGRDAHGPAAPEGDRRGVGVVDRVGQQDVVARLDQGGQGGAEAEGGPVGDEDLAVGVVGQAVVAGQPLGHRLAQARLALVVRIAGPAVAQGALPRPRRCGRASACRAGRASARPGRAPRPGAGGPPAGPR